MKDFAFIFDMDGLLFDTERLFLEQTDKVEEELGYLIPHELHMDAIGRPFPDVKKIFLARLGEDFPMDDFLKKTKALMYAYIEKKGIPVKPGARELLEELKKRGLTTAVASSSYQWMIDRNLTASGLRRFFDLEVGGEQVINGKPSPDIFLLTAKLAGVEPGSCVVLEDSNNGIRAAYAAGMRPVMVPDIKPPEEDVKAMLFLQCADLCEVRERLDEILEEG